MMSLGTESCQSRYPDTNEPVEMKTLLVFITNLKVFGLTRLGPPVQQADALPLSHRGWLNRANCDA